MTVFPAGQIDCDDVLVTVVTSDADALWVELTPSPACGKCANEQSCGTGLLGMPAPKRRVRLPADLSIGVGETLRVVAPPASLRRAALWAYGVPLLTAIAGALVGAWISPPPTADGLSWWSAGGGAGGLIAGFAALRRASPAGIEWRIERLGHGVHPVRFGHRARRA